MSVRVRKAPCVAPKLLKSACLRISLSLLFSFLVTRPVRDLCAVSSRTMVRRANFEKLSIPGENASPCAIRDLFLLRPVVLWSLLKIHSVFPRVNCTRRGSYIFLYVRLCYVQHDKRIWAPIKIPPLRYTRLEWLKWAALFLPFFFVSEAKCCKTIKNERKIM